MRKFLLLLATTAAIVFGVTTPAFAHSDAFSSIPSEGAVVSDVSELQFTFAEELEPTFTPATSLTAATGETFELGAPTFDTTNTVMTVPIVVGLLPDGEYKAATQIVSIDGHPASYELNFTVSGSSAVTDPVQTPVPISEETDQDAIAVTTSAETSSGPGVEFALASLAALVIVGISALTIISLRRRRNQEK